MTRLYDCLNGLWDVKSPIEFNVNLGKGMSCNATRPLATILGPIVKTIILGGRLGFIFMSTTI
jgi:hypothetical protein